MKKACLALCALLLVASLAACHMTAGDGPLGTGLLPIVTDPSETDPPATTLPTVPFASDATVPTEYGTVPSNPGDNIPLPSQPTAPENNQNK